MHQVNSQPVRQRKQRVTIKRPDMVKFIRWLTDNQKMLDQEHFPVQKAWKMAVAAVGVDCSCESFRRLVRDSGIEWSRPMKRGHPTGKIGDRYRFLAITIKKLALQQEEILNILKDLGYKPEAQNINVEALKRFARGQSWNQIKEELQNLEGLEELEELDESPILKG